MFAIRLGIAIGLPHWRNHNLYKIGEFCKLGFMLEKYGKYSESLHSEYYKHKSSYLILMVLRKLNS